MATVDYGGTTSDLIQSFEWITDPDDNPLTVDDVPDVVGNSWGWSPFWIGYDHCDNTFWSVMDGCENAGVVVIFSAGNEGDYGGGSNVPNSLSPMAVCSRSEGVTSNALDRSMASEPAR